MTPSLTSVRVRVYDGTIHSAKLRSDLCAAPVPPCIKRQRERERERERVRESERESESQREKEREREKERLVSLYEEMREKIMRTVFNRPIVTGVLELGATRTYQFA